METVNIYGLIDPRTSQLRYVGKTNKSIATRLNGHLYDRKVGKTTRVGNWIKNLLSDDLKPDIILLETVTESEWVEAEIFWISYFKSLGSNLTNLTDGGDGTNGFKMTDEQKYKLRTALTGLKKKPLSDERKRQISERSKGRPGKPLTDETKKKISLANSGKKHVVSEETKQKISKTLKGRSLSEERIQKIRLATKLAMSRPDIKAKLKRK